MKKLLIILCTPLFLISCGTEKNYPQLILGSWKAEHFDANINDSIFEENAFYGGDSLVVKYWYSKRIHDDLKMRYQIHGRILKMQVENDRHDSEFIIEELTGNHLKIKNVDTGEIIQYLKINR